MSVSRFGFPFLVIVFSVILEACGVSAGGDYAVPDDGMVHGISNAASSPLAPLGMVFVPPGINLVGQQDESNRTFSMASKQRQVTIEGFWMDATEITNNQYRQFVYWVRDSIMAKLLGVVTTGNDGVEYVDWKTYRTKPPQITAEDASTKLSTITIPKKGLPASLASKAYVINTKKLIYSYESFDLKKASKSANRKKSMRAFVDKHKVPVYPDTLVWIQDFTYSYNEPYTRKYWSDAAYGDYPVVGVNWVQANAFCFWRTELMNSYLSRNKRAEKLDYFRLPSEYEWEYAARGGRIKVVYPWGNYFLRNKKGCLLANFKPRRGDYAEDGAIQTARADSYWPNDFGLYNMSGNVAEWTSSVYYEGSTTFINELNPTVEYNVAKKDPLAMRRKVIKGGSWKDVGSLLQIGQKFYEYQDSSKSYIGFRTVISLPIVN